MIDAELKWKYNIGDNIHNEKCNLTLIDRKIEYKEWINNKTGRLNTSRTKYYRYKCNICGYDDGWKEEIELYEHGCPCCSGNIAVDGINTIADKRPDLLKYFKNQNDAHKYTVYSKSIVDMICPICHTERKMMIGILYSQGFHCNRCGDHISYPEKFMMSFFKQYEIDYIYQLSKKTFKWCNKYRYDFYLEKYNCIVEVNGDQHYNKEFTVDGAKTLEEIKNNDRNKKKLALKHGIENYISINCSKSNPDIIIKGIVDSKICDLLEININTLNINKCAIDASKNLLKEVCDFYNNHNNMTPPMIAPYFKVDRVTILGYLKKGAIIGLCNYDVKKARYESQIKGAKAAKEARSKFIEVIDKNGNTIGVFKGSASVIDYFLNEYNIKLCRSSISAVCRGEYKQHCGFIFKYIGED